MSAISNITFETVNGATQNEMVIRLTSGEVIHVSPEFNAVNVFPDEPAFQELDFDRAVVNYVNLSQINE